MSENPALEWNTRSTSIKHQATPSRPKIVPIVCGINSKFNFAPAIVYRKKFDDR